jgi:hypothetical protein
MEEIRHYFDQPKLTCLLCGREYASLGPHLVNTHDLAIDRYKEMYGLPWSKALACKDLREALGRSLRRTRALGKIPATPPQEYIDKMRQGAALLHRQPVEADIRARQGRMRTLGLGRPKKVVCASERMDEYLLRIGIGRTPMEVGNDEDMPFFQYFYRLCSEDPDYLSRFEAIWDQLPFAVQIRGHRTGPRFKTTVQELRRSGKTWDEISRITGVRRVTVCTAWHRWKKSDQADSPRSKCA